MDAIHQKNIKVLTKLIKSGTIKELPRFSDFGIAFFQSGGGNHLYIIRLDEKKFLARVNFYFLKNEWRVKEHEYQCLKMIEELHIAPRAYYLDASGKLLDQHFIIVDFIEGNSLREVADDHVINLAKTLKTLHEGVLFDKSGEEFPPNDELPYKCSIFDDFANGEDKQIEKYRELPDIDKVIDPYKRIVTKLGGWFHGLDFFNECRSFCLCHADLKKENILETPGGGIRLIDWEYSGSDIPETDIGRLFAGCDFTKEQQEIFLSHYFVEPPGIKSHERILSVKLVLDFFRILEDYIILKRKDWDAEAMLGELFTFEDKLDKIVADRTILLEI
ncbi:MAG: phosphotransferase [Patescibacteria group bacterium]